jgi:hypothetical protein
VPQLKRLVADFPPLRSQFVTTAPRVRYVMYSGRDKGFVSEHFGFPCNRSLHQLSVYVYHPRNGPWPQFEQSHPNHKNMKQKEKRLNACLYTPRKIDSSIFAGQTLPCTRLLFYVTTIVCHYRPLHRCTCGRSAERATSVR